MVNIRERIREVLLGKTPLPRVLVDYILDLVLNIEILEEVSGPSIWKRWKGTYSFGYIMPSGPFLKLLPPFGGLIVPGSTGVIGITYVHGSVFRHGISRPLSVSSRCVCFRDCASWRTEIWVRKTAVPFVLHEVLQAETTTTTAHN